MKTSQSNDLESLLSEEQLSPEIRALAAAVQALQEEVRDLRHRVGEHEQDTNLHHTHTMHTIEG
jgi:hypothetical protein